MEKAIIVVNAKVKLEGKLIVSPVTEKMVRSTVAAIESEARDCAIEVVTPAMLRQASDDLCDDRQSCCLLPLTLQIPPAIAFPAREIFLACQDVRKLREWAEQKLNFPALSHHDGLGDRWLPVAVSPSGLDFGELIGEGAIPNAYQQPMEMTAKQQKAIYRLAKKLLEFLKAPPAVYLLQVRLTPSQVLFDRLWPFPAAPAIASFNAAKPSLFHLHWQCVRQQQLVET
jgi:hypothetical protein